MTGLTYYKLAKDIYEGDVTKNCGLQGAEMDLNFYNLKSEDIKNAYWDEKAEELVLVYYRMVEAVDEKGNKVKTNKTIRVKGINPLSLNYNTDTNELSGIARDGEPFKILTKIYTNNTLEGDGTLVNPLRVTSFNRTGVYAPVDTIVEGAENLPTSPVYGKRVVLKETDDIFGRLYTYAEMKEIDRLLKEEGNGWRVATKEDWDKMLNGAEPCDDGRNHHVAKSDYHGLAACSLLKSKNFWLYDEEAQGLDQYGFSIIPAGYYEEDEDYNDFRVSSLFWANSAEAHSEEVYIKEFRYNKSKVRCYTQQVDEGEFRASIRLVNDKAVKSYEQILGNIYATGIMKSWDYKTEDFCDSMYWTLLNVTLSNDKVEGARIPAEYDIPSVVRYYVCEWDGKNWVKQEMSEGEEFVQTQTKKPYTLYRLVGGELISVEGRVEELVKAEEERAISAETILQQNIDAENERAISAETILQEEIEAENERAISAETMLQEDIDAEVERALSAETVLQENIDAEAATREEIDTMLWGAINDEASARTKVDNELWEAIDEEYYGRVEVDNQLWEAISKESSARTEVDNALWGAIELEGSVRENTDKDLYNKVADETNRAVSAETELWGALNEESQSRINSDTAIWSALTQEAEVRQEVDNQQWAQINNAFAAIEQETNDRIMVDNQQWDALAAETEARIANDIKQDGDYTIKATEGFELETNSGVKIPVKFDGDFGTISFE